MIIRTTEMCQIAILDISQKVLRCNLVSSTNLALAVCQIKEGLYLWKDFIFLFQSKTNFCSFHAFLKKEEAEGNFPIIQKKSFFLYSFLSPQMNQNWIDISNLKIEHRQPSAQSPFQKWKSGKSVKNWKELAIELMIESPVLLDFLNLFQISFDWLRK